MKVQIIFSLPENVAFPQNISFLKIRQHMMGLSGEPGTYQVDEFLTGRDVVKEFSCECGSGGD